MNRRTLCKSLALLSAALLTACGGGGGDTDSPSEVTATPPPATPSSYWTMDSYQYVRGVSSIGVATIGGKPLTAAAIGTTYEGPENGLYTGSSITFTFIDTGLGLYSVVPRTLFSTDTADVNRLMIVESNVGIGVTTGATLYTAQSGQVNVTRANDGTYRFSTVGSVPTMKTLDVIGGVAGKPAAMALTVYEAF